MALATLSVDFVAKVAAFEADLKRVARTAEQNGERMAAAFGLAKNGLAGLVAGLSVGASVAFFRNIVDGVDALNDLADSTGASIEKLSSLEDAALSTGTSMETLGGALIKLNQSLNAATPGSRAEQAFKALGLSVIELKRLDPADALRATAVALSGFADDGNKARLSQELFGKSLAVVAPLLKDLVEAGERNATVTAEQAEAASQFNKQIFALQKSAVDLARDLAGPVVESINKTIEAFRQGAKEGKNFYQVIFEEQMRLLGLGDKDPIEGINKRLTELNSLLDTPRRLSLFSGQATELEAERKSLQATLDKLKGAFKPSDNYGEGYRPPAPVIGDKPDVKGDAARRLNEYLAMTRAMADGEEQAARDTTEAWQAWEKIQLRDHEETTKAWALQWKQVFDEIDAEQERAIEEGAAFLAEQAEKANEFQTQAARNIQDALGQSLVQLFDGSFKSIGDLWADTLKKMVAQAAAAQLNKYLFGDTFGKEGGSLGGAVGDLFKLFGSFGGARANGGPVSAGRPYLVGERGPELMVPDASGTVVPNGALGGPQITYAPVFNFTDASAEQMGRIRAVARAEYTRFARQMSIQGAT